MKDNHLHIRISEQEVRLMDEAIIEYNMKYQKHINRSQFVRACILQMIDALSQWEYNNEKEV